MLRAPASRAVLLLMFCTPLRASEQHRGSRRLMNCCKTPLMYSFFLHRVQLDIIQSLNPAETLFVHSAFSGSLRMRCTQWAFYSNSQAASYPGDRRSARWLLGIRKTALIVSTVRFGMVFDL